MTTSDRSPSTASGALSPERPTTLVDALVRAGTVVPDRIAFRTPTEVTTWADHVGRVRRRAGALAARGVRPGDRVLIHAMKSLDTVAMVHACQWAGAVPVPVDPLANADHLVRVAVASDSRLVVVDGVTAARLERSEVASTLPRCSVDAEGAPAQRHGVVADDPAYVIYTSGSTGAPKGIEHTHRSALAYVERAVAAFSLVADDVCANIAPFHFDQSTFELYAPMLVGASTVLVPETFPRFPAELVRLVAETGVTVWYSVPTIITAAVDRGGAADHDLSAVRLVKFGGEAVSAVSIRSAMSVFDHAEFCNVYGPAEVNQCAHHVLPADLADGDDVPIGSPWEGTDLRLRGSDGVLVEGAGRGLLEVATPTMMRAYVADPDRTAASIGFDDAGRRWYRTGDLVDRRADGVYVFVGRLDRQVKVRGVRVELEPVEAALQSAPLIAHAAAVVVGDGPDQQLVGVVEAPADLDRRGVLRSLGRVLPVGAVPDRIEVVAHLPRTVSGKIDAAAAARLAESSPARPHGDPR